MFCSGTLLADNIGSGKPYVSTAEHCIRNQAEADTLITEWFYRSISCNSINSTREYASMSGAYLLASVPATDSALLLLKGTPPQGVVYAAWDAYSTPVYSDDLASISHPQHDSQKINSGQLTGYFNIRGGYISGTNYYTDSTWTSDSNLIKTTLLSEGGSSGGGLFKNINGSPKFIGSAIGGLPSCDTSRYSDFGRFDKSFMASFSDFLSPNGIKPIHRYYNNSTGTHFYTIMATEKTLVDTNWPTIFNYEGVPFKASTNMTAGLSPVHRFFNLNLNTHFYTINDAERAWVVANLPQFRYEGIAWYASSIQSNGSIPLYRFYNTKTGTHFYTVSDSERASVISNLTQYNYEGIAYYVQP